MHGFYGKFEEKSIWHVNDPRRIILHRIRNEDLKGQTTTEYPTTS